MSVLRRGQGGLSRRRSHDRNRKTRDLIEEEVSEAKAPTRRPKPRRKRADTRPVCAYCRKIKVVRTKAMSIAGVEDFVLCPQCHFRLGRPTREEARKIAEEHHAKRRAARESEGSPW